MWHIFFALKSYVSFLSWRYSKFIFLTIDLFILNNVFRLKFNLSYFLLIFLFLFHYLFSFWFSYCLTSFSLISTHLFSHIIIHSTPSFFLLHLIYFLSPLSFLFIIQILTSILTLVFSFSFSFLFLFSFSFSFLIRRLSIVPLHLKHSIHIPLHLMLIEKLKVKK